MQGWSQTQTLEEPLGTEAGDLATERVRELSETGSNKFFIRRLKEDMKDWDGNPLYKKRFTKTTSYNLTPDEKRLYDAVTKYLTKRKEEAAETKNIHVSLALQVMQRRLVSSIYAIRNTLQKRWIALQGLTDELERNPSLWKQKVKLEDFDDINIDDLDDLEDDEREALDNILSNPKKLKLFTTSKSPSEIKAETQEVKGLYLMADSLYNQQQEEQKYKELKHLLTSEGEISRDFNSIVQKYISKKVKGIMVQASTLGSLEAILTYLGEQKIDVAVVGVGNLNKTY